MTLIDIFWQNGRSADSQKEVVGRIALELQVFRRNERRKRFVKVVSALPETFPWSHCHNERQTCFHLPSGSGLQVNTLSALDAQCVDTKADSDCVLEQCGRPSFHDETGEGDKQKVLHRTYSILISWSLWQLPERQPLRLNSIMLSGRSLNFVAVVFPMVAITKGLWIRLK